MSTHEYAFSRILPANILAEHAISLLHHHESIISLSPYVAEYHPLVSPSTNTVRAYEIIDKINYLPFGLYSAKVSVKAEFTNKTSGVTTIRNAPLGITIQEDWSVQPLEPTTENDGTRVELTLKVKMSGSHFTLAIFKGMMERNHENIYFAGMMNLLTKENPL